MRAVVDTNQVLKLPPSPGTNVLGVPITEITLAPYVIAEVLLRNDPEPSLARLRSFDIRYGLEPLEAFNRLASLSAAEIIDFEPFIKPGDFATSDDFCVGVVAPSLNQKKRALILKHNNRTFCGSMFDRAKQMREGLRRANKMAKYANLEEVLSDLPSWPEFVVDWISNGSKRTLRVSDSAVLYSAVKQNQYLARLFMTILYYLVSWSRLWADQSLNFDPSSTRDDWVDITLPSYASDNDLILTADVKLQVAVSKIEPSGKVKARAMI